MGRHARLHDHAVVAFVGHVEARPRHAFLDVRRELRVHGQQVVGLAEVVLYDLPVAGYPSGDGQGPAPVLGLPRLPVFPHGTEVFAQRDAVGVHVDPYPAGKGLAANLHQAQPLAGIPGAEVLRILHGQQSAVTAVGPRVIRAGDALHGTGSIEDQPRAPMLADVVERADGPVVLAHHDEGLGPDVLHLVVARVRHLPGPAKQQPDPAPHPVPLRSGKAAVRVPAAFDVMRGHVGLRPGGRRLRSPVAGVGNQ